MSELAAYWGTLARPTPPDGRLSATVRPMVSELPQDPGWGRPLDIALALVAPPIAFRRSQPAALAALRGLFLAFSMGLALISFVVVPFLSTGTDTDDALDPTVAAGAIAGIGAALHIASRLFASPTRYQSCRSSTELAGLFRSQVFLRLALAETSAMLGFIAFFLTDSVIPYAVGAAWAAIGFLHLAPTRRRLEHLQAEITLQGCPHQLLNALQNTSTHQTPPPHPQP